VEPAWRVDRSPADTRAAQVLSPMMPSAERPTRKDLVASTVAASKVPLGSSVPPRRPP
jgi:hypothetical protein